MPQTALRPASAAGRRTGTSSGLRTFAPAFCLALGLSACATAGPQTGQAATVPLSPDEMTASGAFLAGRYADRIRDVGNASSFMDRVLESGDIGIALKRRAFLLRLEAGRYDDAARLAPEIIDTLDANAPIANIFMAVEAARTGDFFTAGAMIDSLPDNRLNRVLSPLLEGWIALGQGRRDDAEEEINGVLELEGFSVLHALHSAMLADAAGETELAAERYEAAVTSMPDPPLRVRLVAADFQARFQSVEAAMATAIVTDATSADPADVEAYLRRVAETRKGRHLTATDGLAQAFFDLGSALQRDRRSELGMVFSRLALRLDPDFDLATLLIAEILDDREQYAEALSLYDQVPESSAYRLMAELRAVSSLVDLDRMEAAVDRLNALADRRPEQIDPLVRLGDLYRSKENWRGAISAYNRAFNGCPPAIRARGRCTIPAASRWNATSSGPGRGRLPQGAGAAAGAALRAELSGLYLDRSGPKPAEGDQDDRAGRRPAAERRLHRRQPGLGHVPPGALRRGGGASGTGGRAAADRRDHQRPSGDAYWRVGRRQEARFQWQRALSFDPDKDLARSIEHKLQAGLPAVSSQSVKTADTKTDVDG